jgi:3-methyladenine DNA glycosylase AlkD
MPTSRRAQAAPENKPLRASASASDVAQQVRDILAELKRRGSQRNVDGMARYGIVVPSGKIFGVSVGTLRDLGKKLGRHHELALALWDTEWYEARMLAAFVDEPALVTPAQMDRWCRAFDNWAICDHCCFHLFDKTPHAYKKVAQWAKRKPEFERRAAFALLASLAGHDKKAADAAFAKLLPLIERAATDDRNFVKKGVSWALRGIGHRSPALHAQSVALAKRLAASQDSSARWVGTDALRDLTRPLVLKRLAKKKAG